MKAAMVSGPSASIRASRSAAERAVEAAAGRYQVRWSLRGSENPEDDQGHPGVTRGWFSESFAVVLPGDGRVQYNLAPPPDVYVPDKDRP